MKELRINVSDKVAELLEKFSGKANKSISDMAEDFIEESISEYAQAELVLEREKHITEPRMTSEEVRKELGL